MITTAEELIRLCDEASSEIVFLGILCGREFGVATVIHDYKFKTVFPLVKRDLVKLMIGLATSIGVAMLIQTIHASNQ